MRSGCFRCLLCWQAAVSAAVATSAPPAALALGMSNTAALNYSAPYTGYVRVTFSTWLSSFSQLQLDALISNSGQNSNNYLVGPSQAGHVHPGRAGSFSSIESNAAVGDLHTGAGPQHTATLSSPSWQRQPD